ncbi:MAG: TetR family transcriptional regulator [Acidimicrobiales bacterium]|nr:TetR family transcriptional regulator [Acidimicrobiales bacterium]
MPERKRSGAATKDAITAAAAATFREHGYETATLEQVASHLGITRSAILHYFGSKEALLNSIATPFLEDVDRLFDRTAERAPLAARSRRRFITEFVDVLCEHRDMAGLLARSSSAQAHLGPTLQIRDRLVRFIALVCPPAPGPDELVRALAGLGAILRPVAGGESIVDLSRPASRRIVVNASLAALAS